MIPAVGRLWVAVFRLWWASYIHEARFSRPNGGSAPFTCDWGRTGLFRHSVRRQGAGFVETEAPKTFIKVTRPTDADVDGMSRVYQASWKGPATFGWKGPEHGYIARVTPTGYTPKPLPDFETLSDGELIQLLESPSQVRALAAQRTLLRRDESGTTTTSLYTLAADPSKELRSRVLALYTISQRGVDSKHSPRVIETIKTARQRAKYSGICAPGPLGRTWRLIALTAGEAGPQTPADVLIRRC